MTWPNLNTITNEHLDQDTDLTVPASIELFYLAEAIKAIFQAAGTPSGVPLLNTSSELLSEYIPNRIEKTISFRDLKVEGFFRIYSTDAITASQGATLVAQANTNSTEPLKFVPGLGRTFISVNGGSPLRGGTNSRRPLIENATIVREVS